MRTLTPAARLLAAALALLVGAPVVHAADGLAFIGKQQNKVGGLTALHGIVAIAVSPDGRHLYAASTNSSTVTAFARDAASGALRFVEQETDNTNGVDGLDHVRGIALSPDGANLYAAGEVDDAVAVFSRDPATGRLTFVEVQRNGIGGVSALNGPRTVLVSPDGAQVYVTTSGDKSLVVFGRDNQTGTLTFLEASRDGVAGVSGLSGVEQLAFSPDGRDLYVAASGSNSVATFARDSGSGSLTYLGRYQHSSTVFDGLDGVRSVVVSPEGRWVYAGGTLDDAVAIFARSDSAGGALTYVGNIHNAVDGVAGLDVVEAIAMSPDGTRLYATASKTGTVAVFGYDAATGDLTFREKQQDGVGTIEGLAGAAALAVSPDGLSVYVAGSADAIDAFDTRCGDGKVDPGEQCDDGNGADGDGCSAGCRLGCQAATDCTDTDPCTVGVCRSGECAMPECGLHGAICQLTRAIPAMDAAQACLPLRRQLGGTIRIQLRQARTLVQLVRHPPPPVLKKNGKPKKQKKVTPHKLDANVGKVLDTVVLKAGKLEQRGMISPDCLQAVDLATAQLRGELATSILGKGLCAP